MASETKVTLRMLADDVTLADTVKEAKEKLRLPPIGYGVTAPGDETAYECVSRALEAGYRLINTCAAYGNEAGMGRAVAASGVSRSDVFIVSLDCNSKRCSERPESFNGYAAQTEQIHASLARLGADYIDLYLINWPVPRHMEGVWRELNAASWRAMEDCAGRGLVKHIGVSNFLPGHIRELQKSALRPIEANQLEIHPNFQQRETVSFCMEQNMAIMAWSPLFKGKSVNNPVITGLAERCGKTPAQVVLRWNIQRGVTPVVCSTDENRTRSNIDIFDFEISEADMREIDRLETGEHVFAYSYARQTESLL